MEGVLGMNPLGIVAYQRAALSIPAVRAAADQMHAALTEAFGAGAGVVLVYAAEVLEELVADMGEDDQMLVGVLASATLLRCAAGD